MISFLCERLAEFFIVLEIKQQSNVKNSGGFYGNIYF